MKQLTFLELQNYLALKYNEGRTSTALFTKLVEEIGEVAEVLNKLEGRKKNTGNTSLETEFVDVIHHVGAIAGINNIDLTSAITNKDKEAAIKYTQYPNLQECIAHKQ